MSPTTYRCVDFKREPIQLWEWTYATLLIKNDWGEDCTGFLVGRKVSDAYDYKIFLVSNKHTLPKEPNLREKTGEITLHCNIQGPDIATIGKAVTLPLHFDDGGRIWREHADRDVDVMAFDVTSLIVDNPQMQWRFAAYSDFGDKDKLEALDITIAEDILVVGYPSGLTQGTANLPLVRSGIIATRIGEQFKDEIEENGVTRRRTIRGFLIDGATIPGSGGSPVVLKPSAIRVLKGAIHGNVSPPVLLLGIIAETKYAPVSKYIKSFAGLGVAFDAETIKETIELFFQ